MRQIGRTNRVILNLVTYLMNNRNPGTVIVAAGTIRMALHIKTKALEICSTLGISSNQIIKLVSSEKDLRGLGDVQIFDDHSWYEFGYEFGNV